MVTLIEIIDIAVKVGIIAGAATLVTDWRRNRREDKRQREGRRIERLAAPLVAFVDEQLQLMAGAYWRHMDGDEPIDFERLDQHRQKVSMIRARVAALHDAEIVTRYELFSVSFGKFRQALADKEPMRMWEEIEGSEAAAKIIYQRAFDLEIATPSTVVKP